MNASARIWVLFGAFSLTAVLLAFGWERYRLAEAHQHVVELADVLSQELWDLDREGAEHAAARIVALEGYQGLTLVHEDGAPFISVRSEQASQTLVGRLQQSGIPAERSIEVPVLTSHRDEPIGRLVVTLARAELLAFLYALLAIAGAALVAALYLREQEHQDTLQEMRLELERGQRMEAEAKLEEREEQLLEARRLESLGRLAAGVAHDFNNILTVILSQTELLELELEESERGLERATSIRNSVKKGTNLTRQLLAFGRRQVMEPRPIPVNQMVRSMRELILPAIGDEIQLVMEMDSTVPPVLADPAQIEQIIMNLVVNARDAMGANGGTLTIRTLNRVLLEMGEAGPLAGHVLLQVQDSGCGMDAQTQRRIFEPFYTTKGEAGTGLGLSTVYGIVKQMGAHISVDSQVGLGTTFTLYLQPTGELVPEMDTTTSGAVPLPKMVATVLLVEDRSEVRAGLADALRGAGYAVLEASDGSSAMTLCESLGRSIDILVSDVSMPGMSGNALAERLRAKYPHLKVLLISGYAMDAIATGFMPSEDIGLLEKPFGPRKLLVRVQQMLGSEPQQPTRENLQGLADDSVEVGVTES